MGGSKLIVWYTSRRASQQGRSVGPPRPAVGGSVGSGAGRSVGRDEAAQRLALRLECSGLGAACRPEAAAGSSASLGPGDVGEQEQRTVRERQCDRPAFARPDRTAQGAIEL